MKSKENVLEKHEIEVLLTNCKTEEETFLLTALVYTGMRVSELSHMNKSWIKWQNLQIIIPQHDGEWSPKTKQGSRTIPLIEPRLKEVLRAWFTLRENVAMDRSTIWRIVKRVAARSELTKKVYPHALRATFATMLAFMGMSSASIQHILGWAKLTTAESYVQSTGIRAIEEMQEKWKF